VGPASSAAGWRWCGAIGFWRSPARFRSAPTAAALPRTVWLADDPAGQAGIVLPTISPDEEAAMAQITTRPTTEGVVALHRAWDASLFVLQGVVGSVLVFLWWVLLPLGIAGAVLVRRRVVSGTGHRNTSPLTAPGVDEHGV